MKTKREVLSFINNNPVFFLATCAAGTPHVRAVMLYRADEDGIVFNVGSSKEVQKQLAANARIEMCFYSDDDQVQVRIAGTAETVRDLPLKHEVARQHPALRRWTEKHGYDVFSTYRLKGGTALVWSMAANAGPERNYIEF
jgi:uncharacterized pyridoxamine 5'-phosphate oxidase family protein